MTPLPPPGSVTKDPNPSEGDDGKKTRARNVRTALVFLLIALTFFFGAIFSKYMGGYEVGMSVVGFAIFVFLVFAIGRNLRSRK